MARTAKAGGWVMWAGLGAGLGLYIGMVMLPGAHALDRERWADGVRVASVVLICACPGVLALTWAGRRLASVRKTQAARREAWRATLLRHSDPVQAAVDANTARIDGLAQQVGFIATALADVLHQDGTPAADLEATRPILRVVGDRDSA
jgi:hypothetical protein